MTTSKPVCPYVVVREHGNGAEKWTPVIVDERGRDHMWPAVDAASEDEAVAWVRARQSTGLIRTMPVWAERAAARGQSNWTAR